MIATLVAPADLPIPAEGSIGIGTPPAPKRLGVYDSEIDELSRRRIDRLEQRTGHDLELLQNESGWFLWANDVGDAMSEGANADEALSNAEAET